MPDVILRDRVKAVLTITINRPDQRNALNEDVLTAMIDSLHEAKEDGEIRVVVITGAGDKAFCAGADLASGMMQNQSAVEAHDGRAKLRELFLAIERLDKPLVGKVNGHALAGGFGLALGCDLLVAADHAMFGTPEVRVGLWPYVISRVIVDHLGPKQALELMLTGRRLTAAEAHAWGLVNRVVPASELDSAVAELCDELQLGSPVAQSLGRRSYFTSRDTEHHAAMAYLQGMLDLNVQTEDVVEGITAFLEKRDPDWPGR